MIEFGRFNAAKILIDGLEGSFQPGAVGPETAADARSAADSGARFCKLIHTPGPFRDDCGVLRTHSGKLETIPNDAEVPPCAIVFRVMQDGERFGDAILPKGDRQQAFVHRCLSQPGDVIVDGLNARLEDVG